MNTIVVDHISKTFGETRAVDDVSFEVAQGELFGLLGPNGAGKTTAIRLILDIFKPDSGTVAILGGEMTEAKKDRIGYLPEERGLYQEIPLERCLTYLASLKGLTRPQIRQRLEPLLEKFDLVDHRKKKVKELSKGMQQKAQLIVTIIHQPELIIIDEPFSALDPINTQMVKDMLREERNKGATIVMCTHQMNQVEELCDRLVLIDRGRTMLYGELNEIRRRYASPEVIVRTLEPLPAVINGITEIVPQNGDYKLSLAEGVRPNDVLGELLSSGLTMEKFETALPTLDEIFIDVVQGKTGRA
ncbi:MAG: ATP-binding cassette domain-containing protein [Anaerolineae bacterium]|nr:ATP-binding cassette domain-containing protein [Anaerolineae bacterium]